MYMPPKKKPKPKPKKPKSSVRQKQKQTQNVTVNIAAPVKAKRKPRKKKDPVAPFNAPRAGGGGGAGQEFRQVVFAPQVPQAPQKDEDPELRSLLKQMFGGRPQQQQQPNPLALEQAAQQNPLAQQRIEQEPPSSAVIRTRASAQIEPVSTTLRTRTPFVQSQAPAPIVHLKDVKTEQEIENMVKRAKPQLSIAESIAASSRDMDKPFGGGGGGGAAEEPQTEPERIVSDTLDVEAQAAAEKARAKAGAAEDKPMPSKEEMAARIKASTAKVLEKRAARQAEAKDAKAKEKIAKDAAKELAKEEKATLKKLRDDAAAKRKAAVIQSKMGGQIRNY